MRKPLVTVAKIDGSARVLEAVKQMKKMQVYVGVTAQTAQENQDHPDINNAELLFIHTHGSEKMGIPERAVLEPAIKADGKDGAIQTEMRLAAKSTLSGNVDQARIHLTRAGLAGQRAAVQWFTDPRNNWPPNAPSTIKQKGSDRPLINFGDLRHAMTYVVKGDGTK
jgi:hypothetical protein